jgi:outer membrane protein
MKRTRTEMPAMKITRLVLAAALASGGFAHAADLLSIYRDAMVSDPVYQSARAQYQAAIEALPQARAGYLPLVGFEASIFHNDVNRQIAPDLHYNTQSYVVTLSQPIFRLQNWIQIDQAKQQVLQAEANLASAQQDVATRVAQAYFDVLLAQDNVTLSQAQMSAISEQLAQAKRNFEVGTATIVDTLDAQARYDQTSAQLIANQADLEVKRRALQQIVGKLPDTLVPLKEPLTLEQPRPSDIEAWVKTADDSSFAVAIAKANLAIADEEVRRQKAGHLPTLDLTANVGRGINPQSAVPNVIGSTADTSSIGLTLSVPLYSGGLIQSRVRQALANRDKAQQDLENTERTVAQNVRTNFLNVSSGISQVKALEQAVVSTQSQLDSTVLGRDVGVRTSVDVLNAQQQLFQSRRDLQQARYNYLLSTLRLKAAAGALTEDDIEIL